MGWKEQPVWVQLVIVLVVLGFWFSVFFLEILNDILFILFAIIGTALLLIICNRSRRWGVIGGGVVYLLLFFKEYLEDVNCFARTPGAECGISSGLALLIGWALLPLGALVGGGIGWIVGKIRGKK